MFTWLKDFVLEFTDDVGDEGGLGVREEGHRGNQRPAVVVDHVLKA